MWHPKTKYTVYGKWSTFYAFLFLGAIFFSSCSDDATTDKRIRQQQIESVSSTQQISAYAEQKNRI
jgi:hypothetical protein